MTKKKRISSIKFSDFQTCDELSYFLIENDISSLVDVDEREYGLTDLNEVWKKHKDNFKRKFEQ